MDKKREWLRKRNEDARQAHAALMKYYPLTLDNLDGEEWLPVPDFEELYHVSNFGRVKSFWYGKAKILKPLLSTKGYLQVNLHKNDKSKRFRVHRLVALAFVTNPEGKPHINHKDGHPLNCHVSNLEWCTCSENNQHAYDTGLKKSGESHYNAKLTNEQIYYIRENPSGLTTYELAEMFGVKQATISEIQLGKKWKHAGGTIRQSKCPCVSEEIKAQIRAEYKRGSYKFGAVALAKKYGVNWKTISKIVKGK